MRQRPHFRDLALLLLLFVAIPLGLHFTGIGCPIKFLTGISCPGCGMTRAWLSALKLDFAQALAYHPLYWTVPALLVLCLVASNIWNRVRNAILALAIVAFLGVWGIRLAFPELANVIFWDALLDQPVVSIQIPTWLQLLHALLA